MSAAESVPLQSEQCVLDSLGKGMAGPLWLVFVSKQGENQYYNNEFLFSNSRKF